MSTPDGPIRIRVTLDRGLAAYIRADAKGLGIYGGIRETIIAHVRNGVLQDVKNDNILRAMMPHLPRDIQKAWAHRNLFPHQRKEDELT